MHTNFPPLYYLNIACETVGAATKRIYNLHDGRNIEIIDDVHYAVEVAHNVFDEV